MDQETLTNHIAHLSKALFDNACKMVLRDVFNLNPIYVDGKGDGGTDFISTQPNGKRNNVAYQITTQKTDISNKAYKDAKKAIEKLKVERYYFFVSLNIDETSARKIESDISNELQIQSICFGARHIAGFILEENLLHKFLNENNYALPNSYSSTNFDYFESALHSFTLMSKDALSMKNGIYDDSILHVLSCNNNSLTEEELAIKVVEFLSLPESKLEFIKKRIGALFGIQKIIKSESKFISLASNSLEDCNSRKRIYEQELANLASGQIDIMRNDYNKDWTMEEAKKASIWIADAYVSSRIDVLKDIKASIVSNPIFKISKDSLTTLKKYLKNDKKLDNNDTEGAIEKFAKIASNHPLITKIARASVYVALEGANPISSAKALGANRWSDFNIMVEPTIAIPFLCSQLYTGYVNKYFDYSVKSIRRAQRLDSKLFIPYFYINECAGHLLRARKYDGLDLNPDELCYSENAFIANYYSLKKQNIALPDGITNYLRSFSPAILTERTDAKEWIRSIMTDIQSILSKANVNFIEVPYYQNGDCKNFEEEYMRKVLRYNSDKATHLINHDIYALQYTNDCINNKKEHWIILTYDRSMIEVSKSDLYNGWITNPFAYLDLTEESKNLSEAEYVSLLHTVATYSEKTLSAGSRIIDRIINYASKEMQNWQFKEDIEKFKKEALEEIDLNANDANYQIDKKTDKFLFDKGIDTKHKEYTEPDCKIIPPEEDKNG